MSVEQKKTHQQGPTPLAVLIKLRESEIKFMLKFNIILECEHAFKSHNYAHLNMVGFAQIQIEKKPRVRNQSQTQKVC